MSLVRDRLRAADPADTAVPELSPSELEERLDSVLSRPAPLGDSLEPPRPATRLRPALGVALVATTLAMVAVIALLPGSKPAAPADALAAAAEVASEQTPAPLADDEFIYRRSERWRVGVPGPLFNGDDPSPHGPGTERLTELEIYLNYTGGGDSESTNLDPAGPGTFNCTESEVVMAYVTEGQGFCGHESPVADAALFDDRLGLSGGPLHREPLSSTGSGVDDLPTDVDELAPLLDVAALERVAELVKDGSFRDPPDAASRAAARLDLVAGILANPVGSPDLRAAVFEYAHRIPGISVETDVTDPSGRAGTAISLDEPSRFGHVSIGGPGVYDNFHLDEEDTLIRRQLIFDPESSDVLATTASLVRTDNELLGPWLADKGTPALVAYEVFDTPSVVTRPDLVRERVECPGGQIIIRPASSEAPCPIELAEFPPEVRAEVDRILDDIRNGVTAEEGEALEARLEEIQREYPRQPASILPEGGTAIREP